MNRRKFAISSIAFAAIGSRFSTATAQMPESKWDDASMLFGNAWEVIPEGKDGEISVVSSAVAIADPIMKNGRILALVHNRTDKVHTLAGQELNGETLATPSDMMQPYVNPNAYGLVTIDLELDADVPKEVPAFRPIFVDEDQAKDWGYERYTVPLRIDSAVLEGSKLNLKVTNPTNEDLSDSFPGGIVFWFDEKGRLTTGKDITPSMNLTPNGTAEFDNWIGDAYDPANRFLAGLYGYP